MSSYNIYGSSTSPGNGSVGVSSRSSLLTTDRESYSSRIRTREIDNGTYEESTSSHISGSRTSPRYSRTVEDNSEPKKMDSLHTGQEEAGGGTEVSCSSPSQRLKERKGASSSPRSGGKFANRRIREKRRGTGKVVVEDDDFMDELAKENAVKNAMMSGTRNDKDEQTSPAMSQDLQQKKDDDEDDSAQSRMEKRRAARQRRQQEEGSGNGASSCSLTNNDRPSRDRHSGHDSTAVQQKLEIANLTISHLNGEVDRLRKEVTTLKEDLTRERDEKGALLKAMTSLTR